MKIGLISDVHATVNPLREALSIFHEEQVDLSLCAGDIAGYGNELAQTVALLRESDCRVITGNHDIWFLSSPAPSGTEWIEAYFSALPSVLEFTLAGKRLYLVHASPPDSNMKGIKLLDEHGNVLPARRAQWTRNLDGFGYDVLIVGHTHQVFAETLGRTLVINPGSTKFNHTCAILTLPELKVSVYPLTNKAPLKVWNWRQMEKMYED